jgi:serine/threonine protein kinase
MPYYSKGSLQDYLQSNKNKWEKLDILCFLYQICQAFLSFSEHGGCWHLDLKPDNILIKSEGEYSICDFGCAKLVDNINNSKFLEISMNRGGGTTLYAAPEIVLTYRGGKYSDVWSLGVILYKILYGKHPLERAEKYSVVVKNFSTNKIAIEYPSIPGY